MTRDSTGNNISPSAVKAGLVGDRREAGFGFSPRRDCAFHCRGFTLLELLVTIAIISILLSLLLPGVAGVRARSRAFACQMNLRGISFDFRVFADPSLHGNRGDDNTRSGLPNNQFLLETFQESEYRIDEFWGWGAGSTYKGAAVDLRSMNCPDVTGNIVLRASTPCRDGAVQPRPHVSYAFNLRMDHPERMLNGMWVTQQVVLSDRILEAPRPDAIPLVWDIDGAVADSRDITPHYSAGPVGEGRPYSDGQSWFPAYRHQGLMQVAAVDGSVRSTRDALNDSSWDWSYQP